jgi:ectoine hydroxylase-related dioxygenase (phytanoyl-CoA dioxygenase family)
MIIEEALTLLGVRPDTLTDAEKATLDQQGYLPLPGILSAKQIAAMCARTAELAEEEGDKAGTEVHQEAGTIRLSNLPNKDPMFEVCFTHPKVLAAIAHVLQGDLKLSSLNYRAALPGAGLQALHADWGKLETPGDYQVCNSIWLLDDFTEENGATRAVPGSHHWPETPQEAMGNPADPHPQETLLLAPAGTVVVFNSHTWHGGTLNRTSALRRGLHSYFCRRHQPQQLDQKKYLRPETAARLSEAAKTILDV